MYIVEYIVKKLFKKRFDDTQMPNYSPKFDEYERVQTDCEEHVFMPIDSTGDVLSCINCGLVVHKNDLHKSNPF